MRANRAKKAKGRTLFTFDGPSCMRVDYFAARSRSSARCRGRQSPVCVHASTNWMGLAWPLPADSGIGRSCACMHLQVACCWSADHQMIFCCWPLMRRRLAGAPTIRPFQRRPCHARCLARSGVFGGPSHAVGIDRVPVAAVHMIGRRFASPPSWIRYDITTTGHKRRPTNKQEANVTIPFVGPVGRREQQAH